MYNISCEYLLVPYDSSTYDIPTNKHNSMNLSIIITIHRKNKIVKITNLLVSTVARKLYFKRSC